MSGQGAASSAGGPAAAEPGAVGPTRYEEIMLRHSHAPGDLAAAFAAASRAARAAQPIRSPHEAAIRDVAAGVAAPALVGFVLWVFERATERGLERLRFLSRDGQVLYELAQRLSPRLGVDIDLEYVYSSRLSWSLAASDPHRLSSSEWLFNSFLKSNAADLCARLGLPVAEFEEALVTCGVSLDAAVRADSPRQLAALRRFVDRAEVASAMEPRISRARELVCEYALQHSLASPRTGLVDAGWTGRMVGSLCHLLDETKLPRPHVLFWGHEPRASGWTDPERLAAYIYDTSRGQGLQLRIPDAPFLVETFCMSDHGIVAGYDLAADGRVRVVLQSDSNPRARAWGIDLYRATLYSFSSALDGSSSGDVRGLISALMEAFWLRPTRAEAEAWGSYPYDSDPAGTAVRPLARPFQTGDVLAAMKRFHLDRGDRAWLWGSVAMSSYPAHLMHALRAASAVEAGAPALD